MDASIIIPVYRRTEWIGRCIEKLAIQRFDGRFEIIVVDDGSPNVSDLKNLVLGAQGYGKRSRRFLRIGHGGPAAARNFGARAASGDILCFLDDDSLPEEDWLSHITRSFRLSQKVDVVSGKTVSLVRDDLPVLLERSVYPEKSWASCNIAYRRRIFENLGGFDESFPDPSWEDNDLGLRARWKGYVQVYNEKAVVRHPHENTIEEYKKKCMINGRGAAHFSRKYLLKKPLWGVGTVIFMSRRLIYGLLPSVWLKKTGSPAYLKFMWSYYSLRGFMNVCFKEQYEKNTTR